MDDALVDLFDGGADGRHLDAHWIGQKRVSKPCDLLRHGGREEQVLAGLGQHAGQLADGMDETEIKHATNVRSGDRRKWIELARRWHAPPVAIVLDPGKPDASASPATGSRSS